MDRTTPPPTLRLLRGGRPRGAPARRARTQPAFRVISGGRDEHALQQAVEAARAMREEIERRIARALDALDPA